MMRIGDRFTVNTYAYTQSLTAEETVRRLADLGVRALELMFYPGHLWLEDGPAALAGLRRALDRAGATLVSVNTPNIDLNLAAASAEMRAHSLAVNEAYLRIAGALGAGGLVLGPGKANPLFPLPRETMLGHFHAALDRLLPVADAEGVAIWAENQPFAFLPDAAGLVEAVAGHGAVGICYDVANAHFIGEDPLDGLALAGDRLALVHISDTARTAYRHDPVGDGDIDFARLAGAVGSATPGMPPALEIICAEPDRNIARSAAALIAMGY